MVNTRLSGAKPWFWEQMTVHGLMPSVATQRHIWFDPNAPGGTRISKNSTKSINQIAPPGELGWSSDFETWSITLVVFGIRVSHTQTLNLELSNPGFCLENLGIFDGFRQLKTKSQI